MEPGSVLPETEKAAANRTRSAWNNKLLAILQRPSHFLILEKHLLQRRFSKSKSITSRLSLPPISALLTFPSALPPSIFFFSTSFSSFHASPTPPHHIDFSPLLSLSLSLFLVHLSLILSSSLPLCSPLLLPKKSQNHIVSSTGQMNSWAKTCDSSKQRGISFRGQAVTRWNPSSSTPSSRAMASLTLAISRGSKNSYVL